MFSFNYNKSSNSSGQFELELVQLGIVENLVGVDLSEVRVEEANKAVPAPLKSKLTFEVRDLESWKPTADKYDLIVLKMAFHHIERIEGQDTNRYSGF